MYFLGGDRIYIKPERACKSLDEQISNCINQLQKINSGKQVFKLNFFVDTFSRKDYEAINANVQRQIHQNFSTDLVVAFIAQPPLTCRIIVEAFYYDASTWTKSFIGDGQYTACLFENASTRFLIGNAAANHDLSFQENAELAFSSLDSVLTKEKFKVQDIVRQWNYLENILGYDNDQQRYQVFNNVRSDFYGNSFEENGYPAATGIGMNRGGVIIEFVAVQSDEVDSKSVDNPDQISAHRYSEEVLVGEECVLKTTPKFERARYLASGENKIIMISGTASITGERTIGVGDAEKQTETTITNIQRLYSDEVLQQLSEQKLMPKYGHARVYVKNKRDFPVIKRTFRKAYGNLPVVYIIADICRDDLLVEIEGKVILE